MRSAVPPDAAAYDGRRRGGSGEEQSGHRLHRARSLPDSSAAATVRAAPHRPRPRGPRARRRGRSEGDGERARAGALPAVDRTGYVPAVSVGRTRLSPTSTPSATVSRTSETNAEDTATAVRSAHSATSRVTSVPGAGSPTPRPRRTPPG
ncbi:hypothetical protein ACR6C2_17835 [Streptomyces sp. INA 01156]